MGVNQILCTPLKAEVELLVVAANIHKHSHKHTVLCSLNWVSVFALVKEKGLTIMVTWTYRQRDSL